MSDVCPNVYIKCTFIFILKLIPQIHGQWYDHFMTLTEYSHVNDASTNQYSTSKPTAKHVSVIHQPISAQSQVFSDADSMRVMDRPAGGDTGSTPETPEQGKPSNAWIFML